VNDGNRQPLPSIWCFKPISVLPFIFFKLDIIQYDKYIGLYDFSEIADPWESLGLMDRTNHIIPLIIESLSIILMSNIMNYYQLEGLWERLLRVALFSVLFR